MVRGDQLYNQFIAILKEELRPAMGCTEPIALAYAGAKAKQVLGAMPDRLSVLVSGNIIKNVKSVVVPNTGGLRGIAAAICAGVVAGDADKQLEVISCVSAEKQAEMRTTWKPPRSTSPPPIPAWCLTSTCSCLPARAPETAAQVQRNRA